ncbi:MAG: hypothetical protein GY809_28055 [Planctomycetes bacterium]|nr:hypothetical protein [Planctomycetota bacterium]
MPYHSVSTLTILLLISPCLVQADFIHPGLLHHPAELDFIRHRVQAEEQPWFNGWKTLREAHISALDWESGAIADVLRRGYNNPARNPNEEEE